MLSVWCKYNYTASIYMSFVLSKCLLLSNISYITTIRCSVSLSKDTAETLSMHSKHHAYPSGAPDKTSIFWRSTYIKCFFPLNVLQKRFFSVIPCFFYLKYWQGNVFYFVVTIITLRRINIVLAPFQIVKIRLYIMSDSEEKEPCFIFLRQV